MPLSLTLPAIALFSAAAITDLRSRRIPNLLSAGLALVGLARIAAGFATGGAAGAGVDLAAAVAVFAVAAVAFQFRLLGGGDVKLIGAGALWLGADALARFLATTALAGGLLAIVYLAGMRLFPPKGEEPGLPYGIAIAVGGILTTIAELWA